MLEIADGYYDLPRGTLPNVVTFLEMHACPPARPDPPNVRARLRRVEHPERAWYRALYHHVGDAYLWYSRLALDDDGLQAVIGDPRVEIYAVHCDGRDEGVLELDFRASEACEIAYFGLADALVGRGIGRWLMNRTLEIAWAHPIRRLWVHTCTLDHPGALPFYMRSGFIPYKRQLEFARDPRLVGLVPRDAAPQVPMI